MNRIRATRWLLAAAVALLAGCRRDDDLSPPNVIFGQTECAYCRMIVSDERFAAGAVLKLADGQVEKQAYDDIGCLIDVLQESPELTPLALYGRDYETRTWIPAETAVYLHSPQIRTPMASELMVCRSQAAAEKYQREFPGQLVTFAELRRRAASQAAASSVPGRGE